MDVLAYGDQPIGAATGVVVARDDAHFLITNWHVVSGRHNDTKEVLHQGGATPWSLRIYHHVHPRMLRAGAGAWTPRTERLLDDNYDPVWVEHPERFAKNPDAWWIKDIDVVALKVTAVDDLVGLHALSLTPSEDVELAPGAPVSVIGFPFGLTGSDMFPIWKTGHLASDPYADSFEREHLIDITTRQGMSGSPAVHRYWRVDHDGVARPRTGFFGIYSGRVREDSELGIVWRAHLVEEILAKGVRGNVKT